jgi:hypothetical protein
MPDLDRRRPFQGGLRAESVFQRELALDMLGAAS